jgi:NADH-quinone oxidoreductase subunit M
VSLLVFGETLLLWSRFTPAPATSSSSSATPGSGIRHRVCVGVDGNQPAADRPHRLPDAARAAQLVGVGAQADEAFCIFVLLLESAMMGVFVSLDLFLFYIFWDAMLVPMYFLIGIWGYERRIYAAIKFILYTMAASVLMLLAILGLAYLHTTRPASTASIC